MPENSAPECTRAPLDMFGTHGLCPQMLGNRKDAGQKALVRMAQPTRSFYPNATHQA